MSDIRHFLDLDALDGEILRGILDQAYALKRAMKAGDRPPLLRGKLLAMVFEKPSTRTRVSFDVAMRQLGGEPIMLNRVDSQLGRGETVADTSLVLSRYVDAIMIRTTAHSKLIDLADNASVPVINGLTDRTHPCQLMADVMTFEEHRGPIEGRVIAWLGDGNNMATSWIHAAVRFKFTLRLGCPKRLKPPKSVLDWANAKGGDIILTDTSEDAARDADCVVTDTWVSMDDTDGEIQRKLLTPYQVNDQIMSLAKPDAVFMHCLPVYRGDEVTASVIDGPQSIVWDEVENRMHAQKGILTWCLGAAVEL